jgi:uncharacterized membrane protein
MSFAGKLHPLLVHFPIALVLLAAAAEVVAMRTRHAGWRTVAVVNVRVGAALGVLTAIAGWALASAPFVEPGALLTWHRWTGVAGVAGSMAAALAATPSGLASRRWQRVYQTALFGAAALVSVAGHIGGTLVWGPDFLAR